MTIAELIAMVDEIRPNQISKQSKTMWLSEIEQKVFDEVMSRAKGFRPFFAFKPYVYDLNDDTQLAVPDVYADVYRAYLYGKIDMTLGEIDRYNNDAALFSAAWTEYAAWYRRNHRPKGREYYGETALLKYYSKDTPDAGRIPWDQPEPRCGEWRVCGHEEWFRPVLPCYCCQKAERNDNDSPD